MHRHPATCTRYNLHTLHPAHATSCTPCTAPCLQIRGRFIVFKTHLDGNRAGEGVGDTRFRGSSNLVLRRTASGSNTGFIPLLNSTMISFPRNMNASLTDLGFAVMFSNTPLSCADIEPDVCMSGKAHNSRALTRLASSQHYVHCTCVTNGALHMNARACIYQLIVQSPQHRCARSHFCQHPLTQGVVLR